jgi:nicotinamidase/pyrazinamidase
MDALIITDIQHDFLPGGALAVEGGDEIIPLVNRLQDRFPLVVGTQDWHPAGHGSFASAHPGKKVFDHTSLSGVDQILWPDHCVQGTRGAEMAEGVHQEKIAAVFRKGMDPSIDSYSAFYDNGHLKSTGLADYLRGNWVQKVYFTGLAGDFCVAYSVIDAIKEGFDTYLVEDATRPIDPKGFDIMKEKIIALGGKVISSGQLMRS